MSGLIAIKICAPAWAATQAALEAEGHGGVEGELIHDRCPLCMLAATIERKLDEAAVPVN